MPLDPTTVSSADRTGRMVGADNDDAGYHSHAYLTQIEDVEMCRDVYAGTRKLREGGTDYLPQFPKEKDSSYDRRKGQAVLFNGFRRTVKGLTGMVFRKDPVLGDDVPDAIAGHWENIDLAGRHGVVFARDVFESKAIDGHTFILVDWRDAEGARSRAEEEGARPYWVHIKKSQAIRWRTENQGGETVLTRFAYVETDTVDDGAFAEKLILRVRQYDLVDGRVRYRSWTRDAGKNGGDWTPEDDETMGERMTRIPVVCDYADREGVLQSRPPLLDLAFENIRHYQLRSDRDNLIHDTHVPLKVFIGESREKLEGMTLAAGNAVVLENPEADAKVLETTGAALEESREELDDIEGRMAALGVAVIVRKDRVQKTATEASNDKAEEDSDLAAMARGTQDALDEAFALHGMWLDEAEPGTVSVNRDFLAQTISPQMVDVVLKAVEANNLSVETLWDILEAGEVLGDWFDREMEHERIEKQDADSLMAARAVMQQAQQAQQVDEVEVEPEELPEAA